MRPDQGGNVQCRDSECWHQVFDMKNVLFIAFAIAAVSMLTPGDGMAEPTHPNEVGFYLTADGTGPSGTTDSSVPVNAYLVLTEPTLVDNGDPVGGIVGFDCLIHFDPPPNNDLYLLGITFPAGTLTYGPGGPTYPNLAYGFMPLYVTISPSTPLPVTGRTAVLLEVTLLYLSSSALAVYLEPVSSPGIPGQMSFQPSSGERQVMHPISGTHHAPVFIFNGMAVDVETRSFGSVKGLFR